METLRTWSLYSKSKISEQATIICHSIYLRLEELMQRYFMEKHIRRNINSQPFNYSNRGMRMRGTKHIVFRFHVLILLVSQRIKLPKITNLRKGGEEIITGYKKCTGHRLQ